MMVVPVLITNCQVSLKPNSGPVINHAAITATASKNVVGRPARREVALARPENAGKTDLRGTRAIRVRVTVH